MAWQHPLSTHVLSAQGTTFAMVDHGPGPPSLYVVRIVVAACAVRVFLFWWVGGAVPLRGARVLCCDLEPSERYHGTQRMRGRSDSTYFTCTDRITQDRDQGRLIHLFT